MPSRIDPVRATTWHGAPADAVAMTSSTRRTYRRSVLATFRVIEALGVVGVVGACKAVEPPIQSHLPVQIVAVTYPPLSAPVKSQVAKRPVVRVVDQFGEPVARMNLEFVVTAGDGQVDSPSGQTDAQGLASVGWKIGRASCRERV